MNCIRSFILCLLLLCFLQPMQATHIVGGVVYYECQGRNAQTNTATFLITMKIYRDAINGQAPFDDPAILGIFVGGTIAPFQTVSMTRPVIRNIPLVLTNPCLVAPPNVAVEEGVYTAVVTLPYNAAGYHLSYQRCCRNNTISNLIAPGSVGATYTTFISGAAQLACNSSPVFRNFPPIAICQNKPLVFDHSATDRDGNRLEYELCHSFTGGTQANPAPNPPTAPPYGTVPFSAGYGPTNPLNANPVFTIDRNTGLLTGTPTRLGQYVVGICVREFDASGNLLSTTLRDFQFNVAFCEDRVNAQIQADSVDPSGNRFVRNSCGNQTLNFVNQSTIQSFITAYEWRFFLPNGTSFFTASSFNTTVTFPAPGTYRGWLVANPGQTGCTDTAFINVNVYPPLTAAFTFAIDSCNPAVPPIVFTDASTVGGNNTIVQWTWQFGDGTNSSLQNPTRRYANAGNYTTTLTVRDNNGCLATTSRSFGWFPPSLPSFTVNDPDGCAPHAVNFTNTSNPFGPGYSIVWNFGDGSPTNSNANPSHTYAAPGNYFPWVQMVSPWGCVSRDTLDNPIRVFASPQANFASTDTSCVFQSVQFTDQSTSASGNTMAAWSWSLGDGTTGQGQSLSHLYSNAGTYNVRLTVTDNQGCVGTVQRAINWFPSPNLQIVPQFNGCRRDTLRITNTSFPNNGYTNLWQFGDGASSSLTAPQHLYNTAGNYTITLTSTSPTGCRSVYTHSLRVNELPTALFGLNYDSCRYDSIRFTDQSSPNASGDPLQAWTWNFGGGFSSTLQNPAHIYPMAGDYPVVLQVRDVNGCVATYSRTIQWYPAPVIDVRLVADTGCTPFVAFFDNQSYPINGYTTTWSFGDGGSSTQASPTHVYTRQGVFPVNLLIVSPRGCRATYTNTIVVNERPRAEFSYRYDSCAFNGVALDEQGRPNTDGDALRQWFWSFGDGGSSQGVRDTLYPYTPRQNYLATLVVEDINGCRDTLSRNIPYFPAPVFPVPSHSQAACIPASINFDNNPLNNFPGYTFQWNFGDGRSTRAFDTVLVYNTPGRYITTLTILTPAGCRETFRDTLSINGIPTARIGLDYDPCSLGPVRFRNISLPSAQGNITQIQWNFGDGSTGTSPIELHQYPDTAVYAVQLLVSDENNCQDDTVIVFPWLPKPVYPVALANSRGCVPLLAQAVQPNPYPIQGYQTLWTYGDGSQSTQGQASEYVYNNAGIYTRKLVVVSPSGCVDSFQSRHEALAVPIANFNYSPNPVNSLDPLVQFTDLSVDAVNWEWNFGLNRNEGRDYRPSPEHRYRDTGRFTVQLVVQHQSGCRDTLNKDLDIVPKFTYFLPNAFTPNGDGKNDVYMGRGVLDYVEDFSMQIYNRWGERIFETKNPNEAWNGRKNNTGEMCQAGVYVVVVRIKGPRGADQEIKGFATLVN